MGNVAVTINIDSSILPTVESCLCLAAGLPVSAANAKQAVLNFIAAQCVSVLTAQQVPPPPVADPTIGLLS